MLIYRDVQAESSTEHIDLDIYRDVHAQSCTQGTGSCGCIGMHRQRALYKTQAIVYILLRMYRQKAPNRTHALVVVMNIKSESPTQDTGSMAV